MIRARRPSVLFALLFAAVLAPAAAAAQDFPSRRLTLVVPYPPGGSADILAREVGQRLSERLSQPVVVENKAGAGTAIGTRFVAEAPPDGYTLLMGTVSSHAINPAINKVGYDPVADFAPVSPLASIPFVLVTRADSPYRSVADVVAAAKASPDAIGYASAGPGTSNHLAGAMLGTSASVRLLHVPYKGSAPALTDVMAGHVPLMFDLQTTAVPNIRQGRLRALAVTSLTRSAMLPDVPTVAESGLPGFEVSAWFALFAPAKTPPAALQRLSSAMSEVTRAPDMQQKLRDLGAEPDTRSLAAFDTYFRAEVGKYTAAVKAANLAP